MKHQTQFLIIITIGLAHFISAFTSTQFKPTCQVASSPILKRKFNCFQKPLNAGSDNGLNVGDKSNHFPSLLLSRDQDESEINSVVSSLETTFLRPNSRSTTNNSRFKDLIDLYEVQWVLSSNKKNNPVGGKWTRSNGLAQKLFRTRKTYQHLLPYNETGLALQNSETAVAEAVSIISLDALAGLIRTTVILRGDAVPLSSDEITQVNSNRTITPLSNLAVRAYFDPPRIFFGKRTRNGYKYLPLQLGPVSNVVLDTTYYDEALRIGMGGTSGTRFVFVRTRDEEATEFKSLLKLPLARRGKVMRRLGVLSMMSFLVASKGACMPNLCGRLIGITSSSPTAQLARIIISSTSHLLMWRGFRVLAGISSIVTGLALALLSYSSGGIERDEMAQSE